MREIKFRAYRKDYGMKQGITLLDIVEARHNTIERGEIVMQYSGLLGEDGVEIYERDIVSTSRGIAEVRFNHGMFCAKFKGLKQLKPICRNVLKPVTVLGNIYENPELLK